MVKSILIVGLLAALSGCANQSTHRDSGDAWLYSPGPGDASIALGAALMQPRYAPAMPYQGPVTVTPMGPALAGYGRPQMFMVGP